MRKLIAPSKGITLEEMLEVIEKENCVVFYRSGNKKDGAPVFLKVESTGSYFMHVNVKYTPVYISHNVRDTLWEASKSRAIYLLKASETGEIFKLAKEEE